MGNYDTEYNEGPPQLSVRASQHTNTYMNIESTSEFQSLNRDYDKILIFEPDSNTNSL